MLQALRRDEALDAWGFAVRFLALGFGLDFAANDEFADLEGVCCGQQMLSLFPKTRWKK